MAVYNTTHGPVEIWAIVYHHPQHLKHPHLPPLKICLFRVDEDLSPYIVINSLRRTYEGTPNAIPDWDEIREATGDEISWYFKQHPHLLKQNGNGCTDSRFDKKSIELQR